MDVEEDGADLHGVCVDLTHVLAVVRGPHVAHVQVPLLDVRPLQADAFVRDDAAVLEGQQLAPVVQPHHLDRAPAIVNQGVAWVCIVRTEHKPSLTRA